MLFLSVLGKHVYFTLCLVEQQYLVDVDLIQSVVFEKTFLFKKGPKLCLFRQKALRDVFSNRFILGRFSPYSQLPQVFISGTKSECKRLLQTILQNRRLCTLLSPYFTPVASPNEFVTLYEKVVAFLSEDNSDVVFMLLTKVKYS